MGNARFLLATIFLASFPAVAAAGEITFSGMNCESIEYAKAVLHGAGGSMEKAVLARAMFRVNDDARSVVCNVLPPSVMASGGWDVLSDEPVGDATFEMLEVKLTAIVIPSLPETKFTFKKPMIRYGFRLKSGAGQIAPVAGVGGSDI